MCPDSPYSPNRRKPRGRTKEFCLPLTKIKVDRFLFLLVSLLFLLVVRPFLEGFIGLRLLTDAFVTFILISGTYAVSKKRGISISVPVLACLALVGNWSALFLENPILQVMGEVAGVLFFVFTAIALMAYLFKAKDITSDTIIAAICAYLLIGLMWVYVYALLETFHPGTFYSSQAETLSIRSFIYYSFVTLTTLGFGDITPLTSQARSLSLLEAVFGQMYLAVFIARLVGIHIAQSMKNNRT